MLKTNTKKEFQAVFQMSKMIIFEVCFYTLGANKKPYFATSACEFIRSKKDFGRGGQAQKDLLKHYPAARSFFEKWDHLHLKDLNDLQYEEMQNDLIKLKEKYNYIYEELDETKKPYYPRFSFYRLADFSKQEPKKKTN